MQVESVMATEIHEINEGGSSNAFLAFLLGAVLVGIGVVGFFMWDNYKSHTGAPPAPVVTIHKGK
jgi:hypothetical protein